MLESVVFCYCRSFFAVCTVFVSSLLFLEKQAFLSPFRSNLLRPYRHFSPDRNSLSVVFLVQEGPLGWFVTCPKNLLRLFFLPQKLSIFSEVIFRDPPKIPFKTSTKITSRGSFLVSEVLFLPREVISKKKPQISKQGSTPTPWARGLRDQIQKRARQRQKTLFS